VGEVTNAVSLPDLNSTFDGSTRRPHVSGDTPREAEAVREVLAASQPPHG
jgi:hypothetical protein